MSPPTFDTAYDKFVYDIHPRVLAKRAEEGLFTYIGPAMIAIAIFIGSWIAGLLVYEIVMTMFYGCGWRYRLQKTYNTNVGHLIALFLEVSIVIIGTYISFHVVGLPFSILVSIGVLSIIVTYSAIPVISNVSAAFSLYMGGFFKEGQWMKLDAVHQGYVMEIGKMATILEEVYDDNTFIHIIPNRTFFERPYSIDITHNGFRKMSRIPLKPERKKEMKQMTAVTPTQAAAANKLKYRGSE